MNGTITSIGEVAFVGLVAFATFVQALAIASGLARGFRAYIVLFGWGFAVARLAPEILLAGALSLHPLLQVALTLLATGTIMYRLQSPDRKP